MSTAVRVSDELYEAARNAAKAEFRSVPQQIEFWARLGRAAYERLPGHVQLLAQPANLGLRLPHRGHCQPQLRWCHLEGPPALAPARPRREQARPPCARSDLDDVLRSGGQRCP